MADGTRISDAERDRAVAALREHAAVGRLTFDELEERVGRVQAARTAGDLGALLADLPAVALPEDRRLERARDRGELKDHATRYAAMMTLLVLIWAITGADYFWPVWPMLGWGIGLASHAGRVLPARARAPRRVPG